jgi:hypothetical protein
MYIGWAESMVRPVVGLFISSNLAVQDARARRARTGMINFFIFKFSL